MVGTALPPLDENVALGGEEGAVAPVAAAVDDARGAGLALFVTPPLDCVLLHMVPIGMQG